MGFEVERGESPPGDAPQPPQDIRVKVDAWRTGACMNSKTHPHRLMKYTCVRWNFHDCLG